MSHIFPPLLTHSYEQIVAQFKTGKVCIIFDCTAVKLVIISHLCTLPRVLETTEPQSRFLNASPPSSMVVSRLIQNLKMNEPETLEKRALCGDCALIRGPYNHISPQGRAF